MTAPALTRKNRAELWLARWLTRWYGWRPRLLEAWQPVPFALHRFGAAPPNTAAIPRTVWAYWDSGTPPLVVQQIGRAHV